MPDRFYDAFGKFDSSPQCAAGHAADSVQECSAGLHGCDAQVFCDQHLTPCAGGCGRVYCRADAPRFLDGDRCEACADLLTCPTCGERTDFTIHWTCGYLTCDACGARTDVEGLRRANEKRAA